MNAVAIFTGSFAFAAGLTLGMMNAARDRSTVFRRLLIGKATYTTLGGQEATTLLENASPERPFLLLGLPKSGSEAIHNYFTCNNVLSSHYCCDSDAGDLSNDQDNVKTPRMKFPCGDDQVTCGSCVLYNMQKEQPPLDGCGAYKIWSQFDVETTEPFSWFLPQHHALPLLQEAYPGATIILNRRKNANDWAESILHWHSVTQRLFEGFNLEMIPPEDVQSVPDEISYENLVTDMQASLNRAMSTTEWKRKRSLLAEVYEDHIVKVKQFAEDFRMPLLEVVVDDPRQGFIFEELFQLKPDCWKFNVSEYENEWKDFSLPF